MRTSKDQALDGLRHQTIIETSAEGLLQALEAGTVSTKLRQRRNRCAQAEFPGYWQGRIRGV
jgi:hypothetical protein